MEVRFDPKIFYTRMEKVAGTLIIAGQEIPERWKDAEVLWNQGKNLRKLGPCSEKTGKLN